MTSTMRPTFCSWRSFGRTFAGVLTLLVSATGLAGETITYFHNDVVGSPVLATDVNGLQVWKETYRPYGDRLIRSGASSNNTLWFTGKPYDESTGLTYMGARYYDSALGRFMAIDPLPVDFNNLHTFNRYAYASNNPFKFFDPTGMEAACVSYNNCENVQVNEKVVNFMADLMPLVGDAKGFVEAYQDPSVVNTVSAGLGLVPFFGDAASKTLKVGADIAENTTKAARAGAAGTRILVNSAGEAQLVVNGLRVSEHAALRMTERGVSLGALEKTLGQTPFKYFHNGAWKTGFYDPSSRIFAGSINGELTTIINGATPRYIENLMRTVP